MTMTNVMWSQKLNKILKHFCRVPVSGIDSRLHQPTNYYFSMTFFGFYAVCPQVCYMDVMLLSHSIKLIELKKIGLASLLMLH